MYAISGAHPNPRFPMRVLLMLPLALLAGCDALFPSAPDPCPLPASAHPEAWTAIPMTDAQGNILAYSYVCGASR